MKLGKMFVGPLLVCWLPVKQRTVAEFMNKRL